ncbi:MAG: OmpA family protein [Oligoflexia bacterium]|nr:OmpA family protein [Oligoflexia bacterium]
MPAQSQMTPTVPQQAPLSDPGQAQTGTSGSGNQARASALGLSTSAAAGAGGTGAAGSPAAAAPEPDYDAIAARIYTAVDGLGTDEDAIYAALGELGGDARKMIRLKAVYLAKYGEDLDAALDGDLSGSELDRANQLAQREKATFLAAGAYGPQNLAHAVTKGSGTGIGGFEATYIPLADTLLVRVTGKVQFKDAVTGSHPSFTTAHSDLNSLVTFLNSLPAATAAQVLPYFQWTDQAKTEKLALFNTRLTETAGIWQGAGLHFEVDDPEWSDVRAEPLFSLSVGDEGTAAAGENLQVSIYKEPSDTEKTAINGVLSAAHQAPMQAGIAGIRANAGTNLGSNAPGATGNATDENPLQNEMSLSSTDLDSVPDPTQRGGDNFLKKSVMFANGAGALTGAQISSIQTWIVQFNNGDSLAANNAITLRGFASAAGNAADNQTLADQRVASVQAAITGAGVAAARITTDSRGDTEARSADVGQDTAAQANERRVEIRIGTGEQQNTVAHEFGHVFGLSDQYTEGARVAGDNTWQDPTVTAAGISGGSQVEESDNITSVGNQVRPEHYATFAWALNQLTASKLGSRTWHVKQ